MRAHLRTLVMVCTIVLVIRTPCKLHATQAQPQNDTSAHSVVCAPEKPTVLSGQTLTIRAWASASPQAPIHYTWQAPVGHLDAKGPEVQWTLTDVNPGLYTMTVSVRYTTGNLTDCTLRVIVLEPIRKGFSLEPGRTFLLPEQTEAEGYCLYSYLLLGSPPDSGSRQRYLKLIEAYLQIIPEMMRLEQFFEASELNVTYLPVKTKPASGQSISAKWVLTHYDYARARFLLRAIPGTNRDGPYLISILTPLSIAKSLVDQVLHQDLSKMPPHLAFRWMKLFLNQAAQKRFWEEGVVTSMVRNLRIILSSLAEGLPEISAALNDLVMLVSRHDNHRNPNER